MRLTSDIDPDAVAALAGQAGARHVLLAETDADTAQLARACTNRGLTVAVAPRAAEAGAALAVDHVGPLTLLSLTPAREQGPSLAVKHAADRVAAAVLLVVLAPLVAAIAVAVRMSSPGPALYRQRRVGRDGRVFEMLKFRSMRLAPEAPRPGADLPAGAAPGGVEGVDRRTRVGTFLRRSSLDELPQLLNVLRGRDEPRRPAARAARVRPPVRREVARYDDRHRFKSGMTGLAQVHGLRGQTSLRDRLAYDNHYCEQWSLWLDVKVMLRTLCTFVAPE